MKKVFSLAMGFALALGCAFNAEAQDRNLKFNVGAGIGFPSVSVSGGGASASVDLKTTPYAYAGVDYSFAPQFSFEGGLQWAMFGYKGASESESVLTLPVSVRYQVSESLPLSFGAGLYGQKVLAEGAKLDFGLLLKARYDITSSIFAQLQYNLGLKNHGEGDRSAKMNAFQLGVGLTF